MTKQGIGCGLREQKTAASCCGWFKMISRMKFASGLWDADSAEAMQPEELKDLVGKSPAGYAEPAQVKRGGFI